MSALALLEETLAELFERELRAAGATPDLLWRRLEEAGLTLAGVPEAAGGSGGGLEEAAAVVRVAGYFAAPTPLAETAFLAGWLLAEAGLPIPAGPLTATAAESISLRHANGGFVLEGRAARVPWARAARSVVVLAGGHVACVPGEAVGLEQAENLAGEPRDDLVFDGVALTADEARPAPAGVDAESFRARGALARSLAMVGALERVLELSVRYAGERVQFGRPIGRFQAVQQEIAVLAGEVAAATAAVAAAVESCDVLAIAVAKIRAGDAATKGASIAHQVHGAIGFTEEHELHRFTLRLWAWRDEFGSEEHWAVALGKLVAAAGPHGLWPLLTATKEEEHDG